MVLLYILIYVKGLLQFLTAYTKSAEKNFFFLALFFFLDKISILNLNIKNIVADVGYESISNYEYLEKMGYNSYIKPIFFEKSKTRKLKVRSKTSVLREIGLFCMGYNFNRYISRSLRNCKGATLHSLQVV